MIQMTHAYDIKTPSHSDFPHYWSFVGGSTSNAFLCCLPCRYTEQAIEQTIELPMISDAISL